MVGFIGNQQLVEQVVPLQHDVRSLPGRRVAIVTPLTTGTLDQLVDTWAEAVGARRLRYEPFAYEGYYDFTPYDD